MHPTVAGAIANLAACAHFMRSSGSTRVPPGTQILGTAGLTVNVAALSLTIAAIISFFRLKLGVLPVLATAAAAGIMLRLSGLA